jgi:hypothetical protein
MSEMEGRVLGSRRKHQRDPERYTPLVGQPIVKRYDPITEQAHLQVGLPYGAVKVPGLCDVLSYETGTSKGANGFIREKELRMKRRADKEWSQRDE